MTLTSNASATRTYTAVGWSAKTGHEALVDELCDVCLEANKLAYRVAMKKTGKRSTHMADGILADLTTIIGKLQQWEGQNL